MLIYEYYTRLSTNLAGFQTKAPGFAWWMGPRKRNSHHVPPSVKSLSCFTNTRQAKNRTSLPFFSFFSLFFFCPSFQYLQHDTSVQSLCTVSGGYSDSSSSLRCPAWAGSEPSTGGDPDWEVWDEVRGRSSVVSPSCAFVASDVTVSSSCGERAKRDETIFSKERDMKSRRGVSRHGLVVICSQSRCRRPKTFTTKTARFRRRHPKTTLSLSAAGDTSSAQSSEVNDTGLGLGLGLARFDDALQ